MPSSGRYMTRVYTNEISIGALQLNPRVPSLLYLTIHDVSRSTPKTPNFQSLSPSQLGRRTNVVKGDLVVAFDISVLASISILLGTGVACVAGLLEIGFEDEWENG